MALLRDIQLFVAAYEERSFSAAAERENATQSGVSQHIRKLERRAGVSLFHRTANAVVPTPAGDNFYRRAVELLRLHDTAQCELDAFRGLEGVITLGIVPWLARSILAPALMHFVAKHPNVTIRVLEGNSSLLGKQASAGELTFALVPGPVTLAGLASRRLLRSEPILVSRAGSKMPAQTKLEFRDLCGVKMVLPGSETFRRKMLDTYFATNAITLERILELDSMLATLDFVAATDWVSILPAFVLATDPQPERLKLNLLAEPPLSSEFLAVSSARRAIPRAGEALLQALEAEAINVHQRVGRR
jgi:LysR family nitrogen assimilation transcriptional regulator